jgi:hypothetical protein
MTKKELIGKLKKFKDKDEIRITSKDRLYDYGILSVMDRESYTGVKGNKGILILPSSEEVVL